MRRGALLFISALAVSSLPMLAAGSDTPASSQTSAFNISDLDKNGRIDRAEYQRRMVEVFYFADKNKDGVVTVEEVAEIETVDETAFKTADRDRNGKLTVNEFVAYRMIQFDEADANNDAVLTVEEVEVWEKR